MWTLSLCCVHFSSRDSAEKETNASSPMTSTSIERERREISMKMFGLKRVSKTFTTEHVLLGSPVVNVLFMTQTVRVTFP